MFTEFVVKSPTHTLQLENESSPLWSMRIRIRHPADGRSGLSRLLRHECGGHGQTDSAIAARRIARIVLVAAGVIAASGFDGAALIRAKISSHVPNAIVLPSKRTIAMSSTASALGRCDTTITTLPLARRV